MTTGAVIAIGAVSFLLGCLLNFRGQREQQSRDPPLDEQIAGAVKRGGFRIKPPLMFEIDYADFYGERTVRTAAIHVVTREGDKDFALTCYCYLRRGPRTFRLSRIKRASDPKTGEIIDLAACLNEIVPPPEVKPRKQRRKNVG
jgi:hypothetical protein